MKFSMILASSALVIAAVGCGKKSNKDESTTVKPETKTEQKSTPVAKNEPKKSDVAPTPAKSEPKEAIAPEDLIGTEGVTLVGRSGVQSATISVYPILNANRAMITKAQEEAKAADSNDALVPVAQKISAEAKAACQHKAVGQLLIDAEAICQDEGKTFSVLRNVEMSFNASQLGYLENAESYWTSAAWSPILSCTVLKGAIVSCK